MKKCGEPQNATFMDCHSYLGNEANQGGQKRDEDISKGSTIIKNFVKNKYYCGG